MDLELIDTKIAVDLKMYRGETFCPAFFFTEK